MIEDEKYKFENGTLYLKKENGVLEEVFSVSDIDEKEATQIYENLTYIQPCAFDNLPEDCKGKPMMLYCSCPRCSPTY